MYWRVFVLRTFLYQVTPLASFDETTCRVRKSCLLSFLKQYSLRSLLEETIQDLTILVTVRHRANLMGDHEQAWGPMGPHSSKFVQNMSTKRRVLLKVSFENKIMCCLEDTDCCAGSDSTIWKCIPGLCYGYGERSRFPQVFRFLFC